MDESQSVFNKDEKMLISVLVPLFFLQASEAFKSQHNDQISFDVFANRKELFFGVDSFVQVLSNSCSVA